jgi:hypothetical protein
MASSGRLRRVALVFANVSEELSASIIKVTRIGELGTFLVPRSPILVTLMMEALSSSEMLVLTRATQRNLLEEVILYSPGIPRNVHLHLHSSFRSANSLSQFLLLVFFSFPGDKVPQQVFIWQCLYYPERGLVKIPPQ